jgi:hypothetical protein
VLDVSLSSETSEGAEEQSYDLVSKENPLPTPEKQNGSKRSHSETKEVSLNSYKFSRPRFYTPNEYKSPESSVADRLMFLAQNVGPKSRSKFYNEQLTRLMAQSNAKANKKKGRKEVVLNSLYTRPGLKLTHFKVENKSIQALVDTGSTDCFISTKAFSQLESVPFDPYETHMKVAGHVLKDNIIGSTILPIKFETKIGQQICIRQEFLVAHL